MLAEASYKVETQGGVLRLHVEGDWSVASIIRLDDDLRKLTETVVAAREAVFDLSRVTRLDTSGAWVLERTALALEARGLKARYDGLRDEHRILLDKVGALEHVRTPPARRPRATIEIVERIGAAARAMGHQLIVGVSFLGEVVRTLGRVLRNPRRLRAVPLIHHMEKAGFDALPLVCLLTFLIGAVIAQQGASQLRKFGAEVFTVNLITIVFLREVGLLLTAIIVAGRSGSAFTAEIGSMKMREEIDAMRTLGLDPMEMLVLPRILALIIVLPLLAFVADIMGLIGGGVVAMMELNMAPMVYIERLRDSATFWTFGVGLLKAPFMALAIGVVGCRSGLEVTGSAESVGSQTTRSVVRSIFLVIILDAIFAIFFSAIGI